MSKFAVGYSMKKKMAKGGGVRDSDAGAASSAYSSSSAKDMGNGYSSEVVGPKTAYVKHKGKHLDTVHPSDVHRIIKEHGSKKMAEGGDVDHEADMVHRILKKCYSEGGKVANGGDDDLSGMADGDPNNFDDLALRDDLDFHYSGENSGDEEGDSEAAHGGEDMVKRIMKKHKQSNPRPA